MPPGFADVPGMAVKRAPTATAPNARIIDRLTGGTSANIRKMPLRRSRLIPAMPFAKPRAPTEMAKPYWRIGVGAVSKHGDGHVSGLTLSAILLFCRQQTAATQKGIHVRPAKRSSLQIGSRTRARRKLTTASSASRHSVGLRSHLRHPAVLVAEKLDGATAEAVGAPMTSEK